MPRTTNGDKIKIVHVACDIATHLPRGFKAKSSGETRAGDTRHSLVWEKMDKKTIRFKLG